MAILNLRDLLSRKPSANGVIHPDHVVPVEQPTVSPTANSGDAQSVSPALNKGGVKMVGQNRVAREAVSFAKVAITPDELKTLGLPSGSLSVFDDYVRVGDEWVFKASDARFVLTTRQRKYDDLIVEGALIRWVPSVTAIQFQEIGAAMYIADHFDSATGGRDLLVSSGFVAYCEKNKVAHEQYKTCAVFRSRSNPRVARVVAYSETGELIVNLNAALNVNHDRQVVVDRTWISEGMAQEGLETRVNNFNKWLRENVAEDAKGADVNELASRWTLAGYLLDGFQLAQFWNRPLDVSFEDMRLKITGIPEGRKMSKEDHLLFGFRAQAGLDAGIDYWELIYGKKNAVVATEIVAE